MTFPTTDLYLYCPNLFNNRLKSFKKVNHILSNNQYGIREDHSTNLAIIELIEEITSATDNSMSTVCVFIDLKKAFVTIDNGILLKNLNIMRLEELLINGYQII